MLDCGLVDFDDNTKGLYSGADNYIVYPFTE